MLDNKEPEVGLNLPIYILKNMYIWSCHLFTAVIPVL